MIKISEAEKNIGKKVTKGSISETISLLGGPGIELKKRKKIKPFKSGLKVNTVRGVINHPILNVPAYTFEEDDSYVECRRCKIQQKGS